MAEVVSHEAAFNWSEFLVMAGSSVGIALIGITVASLMYRMGQIDPSAIAKNFIAGSKRVSI